jgi:succinate dehydrogenase/fumarate reductase flavoprotein subunit
MASDSLSAMASRPRALEQVERWDRDADVVVVGYGGAGVCAALEAALAGARVLALERAGGGGGTTAMSTAHMYLGGGTRVQKACGFEDSAEEMYKFIMASADDPDEAKVRLYCEQSVEHFNWLLSLGVPFKDSFYPERCLEQPTDDCLIWSGNEKAWPFRSIARPAPRGHKVQAEKEGGPVLFGKLADAAARAGVTLECDTRVLTLITRPADGRVVGVVARQDGGEICVRARRAVILCAGGFAMNPDMLRNHAPVLLEALTIGNMYDDGAGIRMGMAARGAGIHLSRFFITLPYYPPASLTRGILVNKQGQRFVAEDSYHGRVGAALIQQPERVAYLIADNACFGYPWAGLPLAATEGSIEDLEKALKLPATMLQHTVAVYNEHAAKGDDPLFHKHPDWLKPLDEPPFAALDCTFRKDGPFSAFTLGGLRTTADGVVLTEDGEPVPGLYSAGRNSCGIPRSAEGYCSGTSVGDATFFGRRAGKAAAANPAWE